MECSICMEAVASTSNISTTECGHTFHFQCLYTWTRTHTNCPLCRASFGGPEIPPPPINDPLFQILMRGVGGVGRTDPVDEARFLVILAEEANNPPDPPGIPPVEHLRRIGDAIREVNERRPLEEFTGEIDEFDIALVMDQADVDRETAYASICSHSGDLTNAILHLIYDLDGRD